MDNTFALNGLDFSPEINMARYLQSIRKFPILEQDEEFELATRYKETKDEKIAYKLVTSHLRLVVKVVSKYRGYGLPPGEVISEGNIGLLYAVDKSAALANASGKRRQRTAENTLHLFSMCGGWPGALVARSAAASGHALDPASN